MTLSTEAEAIVRALAKHGAPGAFTCSYCKVNHGYAHRKRCIYRRAVEWVRRADAEREGGK